jgi:photoactive yellow protein
MRDRRSGVVICARCAAELKRANLKSPFSYGLCLTCMASAAGDVIEDLSHVEPAVLDSLPFGVIRIIGDGTITAYSRGESVQSGLAPASVIGRNFFREIAPCTIVKEFDGTFEALRATGKNGSAKLRFVFKYALGAKLVEVVMVYHAATGTSTLLVEVVLAEPKLSRVISLTSRPNRFPPYSRSRESTR